LIEGAIHNAAGLLANDKTAKARFTPGTTLNKRYRIVGLLGKGGMGEVYRADDLKLGHPVALKFLSEKLSTDKAMLARFHSEVSVAHRVTHPNVCRVHDIGEVTTSTGKLHFLSMEYVDGEDLSSLLRRIGRLPSDKAVEIANQLCAGLAAAHEAGVLHRDLKPANVMLDGKGRVRITDFGLAGFAEQVRNEEVFAGTPAYMSPEQFAGKEVTTKSDIYALGLVLYEIFTGKRVFEANSLQELQRLHESSSPTNPSNWVKDIDPLVERVILRCLEKDPGRRLASAKQVADALPGGDPLAAALALGETPSPEMVAAAPLEGTLRPAVAVACLAAVLVGLVLIVLLAGKERMAAYGPLEKSPDVLTERARHIIQRLGYTDPPTDSACGFELNDDYLQYVREHDSSPTRWDKLKIGQPAALYFWYRQSPRYLVSVTTQNFPIRALSLTDPPLQAPGMVNVTLDPQGRLLTFHVVPPLMDEPSDAPLAPDWAALFAEAGLEMTNFKPTASRRVPRMGYDSRAAWEGVYPQQPRIPLRIDAAAYRGRAVWFEMIGPWTDPAPRPLERRTGGGPIFWLVFVLVIPLAGALLARRNLRLGRGDSKGAFRLALFGFALCLLAWVFTANFAAGIIQLDIFARMDLPRFIFLSVLSWLNYLALEPYVRRRWPHRIIGWSRLLVGNIRDPLVGRDLLLGGLFAVGSSLLISLALKLALKWPGLMITQPLMANPRTLQGLRGLASVYFDVLAASVFLALSIPFVLMLLSILLRRERLAFVVVWLYFTFLFVTQPGSSGLLAVGIYVTILLVVVARFGLLALIAYLFCYAMIRFYPLTSDFSAWYAVGTIFALGVIVAICGYGFYTSLGGQKVFAGKLLEE
jgi:serine/threonine-protein kinase